MPVFLFFVPSGMLCWCNVEHVNTVLYNVNCGKTVVEIWHVKLLP